MSAPHRPWVSLDGGAAASSSRVAESTLSSGQRILIDRASRTDLSRKGIQELMKHLGDYSDADIDEIFAHLMANRVEGPLCALWCANIAAGRPVDSRHLVDGLCLIPFLHSSLCHLSQFQGDVPSNGLAMLRDKQIHPFVGTICMLFVVVWCQQHGDGEIPAEVFAQLRKMAREPIKTWNKEKQAIPLFCGLLALIEDPGLNEILETQKFPATEANRKAGIELLELLLTGSILEGLPERNSARVVSGGTLRCDIRRPGRNDACHCGSGKKYKKCCEAQDRRQDLESPAAAGLVTREPPEPTKLTDKKIYLLSTRQAFELEIRDVPPHLRAALFVRLWSGQEYARIAEHCRSLSEDEFDDDLREMLEGIFHSAMSRGQLALARLLAETLPWLGHSENLANSLMVEKDGAAILDLLESQARECIEDEDSPGAAWMVTSLLQSGRYPALGVLLARGVIASNEPKLGESVLRSVRKVLDANQWNPFDPAEDILDLVYRSKDEERETENAVAKVKSEANAELEAKRDEIRRLQWELKRTQHSLKTHQAPTKGREEPTEGLTAHSVPEVSQPVSGKRLREVKELRERCARLQDELRQRHTERNEMRRSLHDAQESLARKSQDRSGHDADGAAEEAEEDLLLEHTVLPNWPARFPVWPPDVRTRRKVPDAIWRAALNLTGRLAAGDPGAVQGVKVLKGLNGIYRQRFAGSWRLLFELDDDELRVIDLIPRRDLIPWARARASR